jgi:uncharacterized membrane protein
MRHAARWYAVVRALILAGLLGASVPGGAAAEAPVGYTIREVVQEGAGPLLYPDTISPTGINSAGLVVGDTPALPCCERAVLWRSGRTTDLGVVRSSVTYSTAVAINDRAQVLAEDFRPLPGGHRAFVWQDGQGRDVPFPDGEAETFGLGLNNLGHVLVYADAYLGQLSFQALGVYLVRDGQVVRVDSPEFTARHVTNNLLNDRDQIAGIDPVTRAVAVWQDGRVVATVPLPNLLYSEPVGINNSGDVIGTWTERGAPRPDGATAIGPSHGFLWQGGRLIELPPLPGDAYVLPRALNERGQVVGVSYPPDSGPGRAVLWQNGRPVELSTLLPPGAGWDSLDVPTGVNDLGQIVGTGYVRKGQPRGFLLTPLAAVRATALTYAGDARVANGRPASLAARLTVADGGAPVPGRSVVLTLGSGAAAQSCTGTTDATGLAACGLTPANQPGGTISIAASFAGDALFGSASASASVFVVTYASLCDLSRRAVTDAALAPAMCAALGAAQRAEQAGSASGKATALAGYARLVAGALRAGAVTAADASRLTQATGLL